jgi:NAD-dependent SIR2 family protein deacetylase
MEVSETQRQYLRHAQEAWRRRDVGEFISIVYRVITDSDITRGREQLDKGWVDIWHEAVESGMRFRVPEAMVNEIDQAMAKIEPTDRALWDIRLSDDEPLTVLLGAGASKPAPSNIPVVAEFLPELWRRAKKLDRDDLNKLASWCDDNNISNIEDLLTAAQIANFSTKSGGILGLLYYFLYSRDTRMPTEVPEVGRRVTRSVARVQPSDISAVALLQDTLQVLFSLLAEPMISAKPNAGHTALAKLISKHKNTFLITTNYDGCIDEAIKQADIPFEYLLGEAEHGIDAEIPKLVKMHGSINWFYCESCQEMDRYDLSDIKQAYQEDKMSYPVIGICKHCGGLSRPMIVPPLSFKLLMFPPLAGLWDKTQIAFQKARVILVVGYSFSEADTYITKMIIRAMGADSTKRLIIVDIDSAIGSIVVGKLAAHIDRFAKERVIRARESCDILLPRLCDSLVGKKPPTVASTRKTATKKTTSQ